MKIFTSFNLIRFGVAIFFCLAVLFTFSQSASAEIIRSFDSTIEVGQDGSLSVRETIQYDFESAERHGIFRDIPLRYDTATSSRSIDLEILQVLRDGGTEPFDTSKKSGNFSVRIGDADTLITGLHTYTLIYTVRDALTQFPEFDELYWNITGNDWPVPIQSISATVTTPSPILQTSCYEGVLGSDRACTHRPATQYKRVFRGTSSFDVGEGLSISVGFESGAVIIPEETTLEKIFAWLRKVGVFGAIPLFFFFVYRYWRKKGKDPKGRGTIVTQYTPPDHLFPTMVGTLVDGRADNRDITAGLVYAAQKGYVTITHIEKKWLLCSSDYSIEIIKNTSNLPQLEQDILGLFFEENLSVGAIATLSALKKDSHFASQAKKLKQSILDELVSQSFYEPHGITRMIIMLVPSVFLLGIGFSFLSFWISGAITFVAIAVILIFFAPHMRKRTILGTEIREHILGFKHYISVAEKDRMKFHSPPERNQRHFMEVLPYAIALGVESTWAKQFKDIYMSDVSWYQGTSANWSTAGFGSFVSDLSKFSASAGSGFSQRSSTSGGGGFSGGGAGGGGGGSW